MYITFFLWKLASPGKVLKEVLRLCTREFETKMEMSIYKQVKLYLLAYVPIIFKKLDSNKMMKDLNRWDSRQTNDLK